MLRQTAATEDTLQKVLNEAIRIRQIHQQVLGVQESLLRIHMENNVLLRRMAGVHTGDMPAVRAQYGSPPWGPDRSAT